MPISAVFSVLFFFTFAIYLLFGLHTLILNPRGTINRVFFLLSLTLAVWAFAFAFANHTQQIGTATQ